MFVKTFTNVSTGLLLCLEIFVEKGRRVPEGNFLHSSTPYPFLRFPLNQLTFYWQNSVFGLKLTVQVNSLICRPLKYGKCGGLFDRFLGFVYPSQNEGVHGELLKITGKSLGTNCSVIWIDELSPKRFVLTRQKGLMWVLLFFVWKTTFSGGWKDPRNRVISSRSYESILETGEEVK